MEQSPIVTLDSVHCQCGRAVRVWKVNKEGPNKGKSFYKCALQKCRFWQWADEEPRGYDPERFKPGACFRCGFYGCEITDCDRDTDWFGNKIPPFEEQDKLIVAVPKKQ